MAINITDFDKIWASTSPLTPYSFTDANYEEGWNFVGATPPARQMWDGYMKFSDEKQQYIVKNFLPLTGGVVKGSIFLQRDVDDAWLQFNGGSATGNGANLLLFGKDESRAGQFWLSANDGNGTKQLIGKADETLTWAGKPILVKNINVMVGKTASTSVNANSTATVSISFSPTFATTPIVFTTVQTGYNGFYASVSNITTSGATITINNASSNARSVVVDWIAFAL